MSVSVFIGEPLRHRLRSRGDQLTLTSVFSFWLDFLLFFFQVWREHSKFDERAARGNQISNDACWRCLSAYRYRFFLFSPRPYQDGSLVFEVRLGDVMDLVCPFYDEQQSYMTSELEQYEIHRVSRLSSQLLTSLSLSECLVRCPKKNTKHVPSTRTAPIHSHVVWSRATVLTMWWSTRWTFVRIYRSRMDLSFVRIKPITSCQTHSVSNHVTNSKFLYMTIVSVHLHISLELGRARERETAADVLPHCTRFEN